MNDRLNELKMIFEGEALQPRALEIASADYPRYDELFFILPSSL